VPCGSSAVLSAQFLKLGIVCSLAFTRKYLSIGQELMEFGATDVRSSSVPGRLQQYARSITFSYRSVSGSAITSSTDESREAEHIRGTRLHGSTSMLRCDKWAMMVRRKW
jgi:hypothetical protein